MSRPLTQTRIKETAKAILRAQALVATMTPAHIESRANGDELFSVPSQTDPSDNHIVTHITHAPYAGDFVCTCTASQFGSICTHVGAVMLRYFPKDAEAIVALANDIFGDTWRPVAKKTRAQLAAERAEKKAAEAAAKARDLSVARIAPAVYRDASGLMCRGVQA